MFNKLVNKLKSKLSGVKDLAEKSKRQLTDKSGQFLKDTNLKKKFDEGREKLVEKSKSLKDQAQKSGLECKFSGLMSKTKEMAEKVKNKVPLDKEKLSQAVKAGKSKMTALKDQAESKLRTKRDSNSSDKPENQDESSKDNPKD